MTDTELYPDFKSLNKIINILDHEKIKIKTQNVNSLSGIYKSKYKSSGLIFDNIRKYQFGDDKRAIDWKASARTGKLHVKEFIEERNTELVIAVNNSSEMFFASKYKFKSYLAIEVFAFIASLALSHHDYITPLIFNSDIDKNFYTKTNNKKSLYYVLNKIITSSHSKENYLSNINVFSELRKRKLSGKNIFIILPILYDFNDEYKTIIKQLAKNNQLNIFFVWDDLESNLPSLQDFEISNIKNRGFLLNTADIKSKKYSEFFKNKFYEIDTFLNLNQIKHLFLNTKDDAFINLLSFFRD